MRAYEYRHIVGFEETNLVGNVYYTNHLKWQGRCRELFLREFVPDLLDSLQGDLALVTLSCSCDYLSELNAFDEVIVSMRLDEIVQNRISLLFDYSKVISGGLIAVARGSQQVACMKRDGNSLVPTEIPTSLREALRPYAR
jgi:enediyne biosynthesis thioesterase